jgi:hypothetical protein
LLYLFLLFFFDTLSRMGSRRVHIFNRPISDDPTKSLGIKTEHNNIQLFIRGETSKVINPRVVVFPEGLSPRKYNLSRVGNLILTSYEGNNCFIILGRNYSKMFITWTWPWLDSFLNEAKTLNRGKIWARGPVATPDAPTWKTQNPRFSPFPDISFLVQ